MNRDNQQAIYKETEIAWLAGIIEGEGTISLSCYSRKDLSYPKISVSVVLSNTDAGIVEQCVNVLDKIDIPYHIKEREQKPIVHKNGTYISKDSIFVVSLKGMANIFEFLKILTPYLYGDKKHRALVVMRFVAGRVAKQNRLGYAHVPLEQKDVDIVIEFYERFVRRPGNKKESVIESLRDYTRKYSGEPVDLAV